MLLRKWLNKLAFLPKWRLRFEIDKGSFIHEIRDVRSATDEIGRSKVAAENSDLLRQVQKLENQANMFTKTKILFQPRLDEAKRVADECKKRQPLLVAFSMSLMELESHQ